MASVFSGVSAVPPIEIFNVNKVATEDNHPNKINLSVGAYRTNEGKPWVLPVVKEAEQRLAHELGSSLNHEYLPILGLAEFSKAATELLLGSEHDVIQSGKAFGIQCLSGTGSLRVGADFLAKVLGFKTFCVSTPTWGNHKLVFKHAGFDDCKDYRYWDKVKKCIDFDGWIQDLESYHENSVVIMHGCAHNPTGMDPTKEQWKKVLEVVKRKKLFPFFDIAYQGFASGDANEDAWAVRLFASEGLSLLVAQSFAKNFGLYNERVGNLVVVTQDAGCIPAVKSQLTVLVRANYSNPPAHGARVVHMVLTDPALREQWFQHIAEMSRRIKTMRQILRENLEKLGTTGTWDHITKQIGMFSFTGLTETQVEMLRTKHHCHTIKNGRINMCALNMSNIEYFSNAVHDVVTSS